MHAPPMWRRLACFIYEGVLLFGVVMMAGLVYATLTGQHHALVGTTGLQTVLFCVLGAYFTGFWSHSGQTLAMQTWRVRLVTAANQRVSAGRALVRYVLCWLWFLPALLAISAAGLKTPMPMFLAVFVGVVAYAALAWLRPDRQYWHDVVCGTRLVSTTQRLRPSPPCEFAPPAPRL